MTDPLATLEKALSARATRKKEARPIQRVGEDADAFVDRYNAELNDREHKLVDDFDGECPGCLAHSSASALSSKVPFRISWVDSATLVPVESKPISTNKFTDGRPLSELESSLQANARPYFEAHLKELTLPCYHYNGKTYSLGTRRLLVYQRLGLREVPVTFDLLQKQVDGSETGHPQLSNHRGGVFNDAYFATKLRNNN